MQMEVIQALEEQLANSLSPDHRIAALNALAWELLKANVHRAVHLAQEAIDLAQAYQDKAGEAMGILITGTYELEYGTTARAEELLELAHLHYKNSSDTINYARTLDSLGWCKYIRGEYDEALEYHQTALVLREAVGDPREMVDSLNSISAVYCELGKYPEAFDKLLLAIDMADQYQGERDLIRLLSNAGCTYLEVGENELALQSYTRVLELAVDPKYKKNRCFTFASLGLLYHEMGDFQRCLQYSELSLKELPEGQIPRYQVADTYINMGNACCSLQDYDAAERYLQMGIDICREISDTTTESKALMGIGQLYAARGQFEEGLQAMQSGLTKAVEVNYPHMTYAIHEAMAEIYEKLGRFDLAYRHYRQFQEVRESIFNRDSIARRRLMELQYDLDRAKQEKQFAEKLRQAGLALNATLDVDHVLDIILEQVQNIVPYDAADIYFLENDQVKPVRSIGYGRFSKQVIDCRQTTHFAVSELPGFQTMLDTGQPYIIPDTKNVPIWDHCLSNEQIRSWLGAPIVAKDQIVAFITLMSKQPNTYQSRKAGYLAIYVSQAGLALENARLFEEVQRLAITDDLTGLFNHRYLYYIGQRMVTQNQRYQTKLSALMLDLDHFKEINDTFGHLVGDQVLQELSKLLFRNLRSADILGRFGGEEFVVLMPETGIEAAVEVAERLRVEISKIEFVFPSGRVVTTASLGVAEMQPGWDDLEDLIRAADLALYQSKQAGRNQVTAVNSLPE